MAKKEGPAYLLKVNRIDDENRKPLLLELTWQKSV